MEIKKPDHHPDLQPYKKPADPARTAEKELARLTRILNGSHVETKDESLRFLGLAKRYGGMK